jgi:excisionase family DNA binding protein
MAKTPAGSQPSEFHTIDDVANMLEVSTRTVRRWIEKELLVAYTVGNIVRIAKRDIQTFLAAHRGG